METIPNKVQEVIDDLGWMEPVAEQLQLVVRSGFTSLGRIGRLIKNFLHGTWLGHPLHPVITDVAIGSWSAAVLLDALEATTGEKAFGKGADVSVILGLSGAVGSAVTGVTDWQHLSGEQRRYGFIHALLNISATLLFLLSLTHRRNHKRSMGRNLALSGYTLTFLAAYLGGDLVYRQKVGVNHAPTTQISPRFIDVMDEDDLPKGQLKRILVDDVPVLLVRQGDEVYAIAETCSHLGGPLAEGKLGEDHSVTCPWHGSRFDLATGRVLDGPSTYNQPCYQARIRDRRIEIRERDRFEITGVAEGS